MKIRSDFVTNSSSANYILELAFTNEDNKTARFSLAVSPETCGSLDGDMKADGISLNPNNTSSGVYITGKSLSSSRDIRELCELLLSSATIDGWKKKTGGKIFVLSEKTQHLLDDIEFMSWECWPSLEEFLGDEDEDEEIESEAGDSDEEALDDDYGEYLVIDSADPPEKEIARAKRGGLKVIDVNELQDYIDACWYEKEFGTSISVLTAAPKTTQRFIDDCENQDITLQNLKTIIIENSESGHGDSAIFINHKEFLEAFYADCEKKGIDREDNTVEKLVTFAKSEPKGLAASNSGKYLRDAVCVYGGGAEQLVSEMRQLLNGNLNRDYWMATYSRVYTIDVKQNRMTSRNVVFYS